MLSFDKLRPKSMQEFMYNRDVAGFLEFLASHDNVPHVILVGPRESGMKVLVNYFLKCIYGDGIYNTYNKQYTVSSASPKSKEIDIIQSFSHIVLEPEGTNRDKYVVQEIVKSYATNRMILTIPTECTWSKTMTTKSRSFKSIVIYNIENLVLNSQAALRRSMEKYAKICRFVMTCNNMSSIIDPLRSRCMTVSISAPTKTDIQRVVFNAFTGSEIDYKIFKLIVDKCDGSVKKALFLYDYHKYGIEDVTKISNSIDFVVDKVIECHAKPIIPTIISMMIIPKIYKILTANIQSTELLRMLLDRFLVKVPNDRVKIDIIKHASKVEYDMHRGRRTMECVAYFINSVVRALTMYPIKAVAKKTAARPSAKKLAGSKKIKR